MPKQHSFWRATHSPLMGYLAPGAWGGLHSVRCWWGFSRRRLGVSIQHDGNHGEEGQQSKDTCSILSRHLCLSWSIGCTIGTPCAAGGFFTAEIGVSIQHDGNQGEGGRKRRKERASEGACQDVAGSRSMVGYTEASAWSLVRPFTAEMGVFTKHKGMHGPAFPPLQEPLSSSGVHSWVHPWMVEPAGGVQTFKPEEHPLLLVAAFLEPAGGLNLQTRKQSSLPVCFS